MVQAVWLTSFFATLSFLDTRAMAQPVSYGLRGAKTELDRRLRTSADDEQRLALLLEVVADPESGTELREEAAERLPSLMPVTRRDELFELQRIEKERAPHETVASALLQAAWKLEITTYSPEDALDILEGMVTGTYQGDRRVASWWAAEELCERGALSRFKAVLNFYRSLSSDTSRVLRKVRFCHQRMTVLAEAASPEQGYIVALGDTSPERRLASWAVRKLAANRSETAEGALLARGRQLNDSDDRMDIAIYSEIYRTLAQWDLSGEALREAGLTRPPNLH